MRHLESFWVQHDPSGGLASRTFFQQEKIILSGSSVSRGFLDGRIVQLSIETSLVLKKKNSPKLSSVIGLLAGSLRFYGNKFSAHK
jgi:hypothetical protein